MKKLLPLLVCVLMSGCAAKVLSSSEKSVIVQARIQDVAEAQHLADAECKQRGTLAKLSGKLTINQYIFDCVN